LIGHLSILYVCIDRLLFGKFDIQMVDVLHSFSASDLTKSLFLFPPINYKYSICFIF